MKKNRKIFLCTVAIWLAITATRSYASSASYEFIQFARGTSNFSFGRMNIQGDPSVKNFFSSGFSSKEANELFYKILKEEFAVKIGVTPMTMDDLTANQVDSTQPLRTDVVVVSGRLFVFSGSQLSPQVDHNFGVFTLEFGKFDEASPFRGAMKMYTFNESHPDFFILKEDARELQTQIHEIILKRLNKEFVKILCFDKLSVQCAGKVGEPVKDDGINRPQ